MQLLFILNLNYELFHSLVVIMFKQKLIRFSNGMKINLCKNRIEERLKLQVTHYIQYYVRIHVLPNVTKIFLAEKAQ